MIAEAGEPRAMSGNGKHAGRLLHGVSAGRRGGQIAHGFTYGRHPVPAAVALETLKIYEERDIVGHVASPRRLKTD